MGRRISSGTSSAIDDRIIATRPAKSRKRKRNLESWKSEVRKRRRNCGESYISTSNKQVQYVFKLS